MFEILKDRLSVICALVLGTGGGWCMSALITAPELKQRMVTISIAVSLLLSIIISTSLKGKLKAKSNYRAAAVRHAWLIFAGFVLSVVFFFIVYDKYTIGIPHWNESGKTDTLVIVKGLYYTDAAKAYTQKLVKKNHQYPDDNLLLNDYTYEVSKVWPEKSTMLARLLLLVLYATMIALLTAGVTYGTEIIQLDKSG